MTIGISTSSLLEERTSSERSLGFAGPVSSDNGESAFVVDMTKGMTCSVGLTSSIVSDSFDVVVIGAAVDVELEVVVVVVVVVGTAVVVVVVVVVVGVTVVVVAVVVAVVVVVVVVVVVAVVVVVVVNGSTGLNIAGG